MATVDYKSGQYGIGNDADAAFEPQFNTYLQNYLSRIPGLSDEHIQSGLQNAQAGWGGPMGSGSNPFTAAYQAAINIGNSAGYDFAGNVPYDQAAANEMQRLAVERSPEGYARSHDTSAWVQLRDAGEAAAVEAGNYYFPGSALVTGNLVSEGAQEHLSSPLGRIATLATGVAGGVNNGFDNYKSVLGIGGTAGGAAGGVGSAAELGPSAGVDPDVVGGFESGYEPVNQLSNNAVSSAISMPGDASISVSPMVSSAGASSMAEDEARRRLLETIGQEGMDGYDVADPFQRMGEISGTPDSRIGQVADRYEGYGSGSGEGQINAPTSWGSVGDYVKAGGNVAAAIRALMGGGTAVGGAGRPGPAGATVNTAFPIINGVAARREADRIDSIAPRIMDRADPLGANNNRQQYIDRLNTLIKDPSSIYGMPGWEAGNEAVQRSMAANGYLGSGNMMVALQKYGGDFYNNEVNRMAKLAGADFDPANAAKLGLAAQEDASGLRIAGNNDIGYGIGQGASYIDRLLQMMGA